MLASPADKAESTSGVRKVSAVLYWFFSTYQVWSHSSRRDSLEVRWGLGCSTGKYLQDPKGLKRLNMCLNSDFLASFMQNQQVPAAEAWAKKNARENLLGSKTPA